MARSKFFLDTYAMLEYLAGNEGYRRRMVGAELVTSLVNLAELYYIVLREHSGKEADDAYSVFRNYQAEITDDDVKHGMTLRLAAHARKSGLSYADALGYAASQRLGLRYLTGDDAFRSMSGVEFVK
jgi:predicted nucleic acid-binding protein